MADIVARSWLMNEAPDGRRYSAYPDGVLASWNLPATINVQQSGSVGLRQYAVNADGWTISVTGLPAGVTYNAGTEELEGAASGTATATATFTLTLGAAVVQDTATVGLVAGPETIINVSTVSQLQAAVATANSQGGNVEIRLADGTYQITEQFGLLVTAPNVTFRSQSGNRASVVVRGDSSASNANIRFIFVAHAPGLVIQDLTAELCRWSVVQIEQQNGGNAVTLRNAVLRNSGEHIIKGTVANTAVDSGGTSGLVEDCWIGFTSGYAPQSYNGGIDVHNAKNWIVRRNWFQGIRSPDSTPCQHAVSFWNHCAGNEVYENIVLNCDRGIGFGLTDSAHTQNIGGRIVNNFVCRTEAGNAPSVMIGLEKSPGTKVFNNTVYSADNQGGLNASIDYRFSATTTASGVEIRNNLCSHAVAARNGASAATGNNATNAQAGWFVNPAAGNLRLVSAQAGVVDAGATIASVPTDIDGTSRPQGSGYDIGAFEWITPPPPPEDPLDYPLVQAGDIQYLGSFSFSAGNRIAFAGGGQFYSIHQEDGGTTPQIRLYNIPAIGGSAQLVAGPANMPTTGFGSGGRQFMSALRVGARTLYNRSVEYDASFTQNHFIASVASSDFGSPTSPQAASGMPSGTLQRGMVGTLSVIPTEYRSLFDGADCVSCNIALSIVDADSYGPSFTAFSSAAVTGSGSVPVQSLMQMGRNSGGSAQWWKVSSGANPEPVTEFVGALAAGIVPGTRTYLICGYQSTNPNTSYPYNPGTHRLEWWPIDIADLVTVKNGQAAAHAVRPYDRTFPGSFGWNWEGWTTPQPPGGFGGFDWGENISFFDHETRRFYICDFRWPSTRNIHVFQVNV